MDVGNLEEQECIKIPYDITKIWDFQKVGYIAVTFILGRMTATTTYGHKKSGAISDSAHLCKKVQVTSSTSS